MQFRATAEMTRDANTRREQMPSAMLPNSDIARRIRHFVLVLPKADIDALLDHLISTARQRERDENAQRLGRLLRPMMIMANSKEAQPSGFTGVKSPAKHF